ncbi:MAG: efflux RND transporter periplasmic adaptor subunit [Alphaproteobacteria bacterium]|nr:efflux RND transporter periplasmic adaptor subunit [Alphaproteobacteria bacterium]
MRAYIFIIFLFTFIPPAFAVEALYICPMHPHISGQEGDNCPICGMFLVSQPDEVLEHEEKERSLEGSFKVNTSYIQTLGVRTSKITHQQFGKNIRAFGSVLASTRLEHAIDVRTKGWIVDLETSAIGDKVKKGDLLFNYYSPKLMEAQSDFLVGRRLGNPEQRLRFFGMSTKAISELKKRGKFIEKTPFYAPIDGTVTRLNVRKGSHVQEGGAVMVLQDFSEIWVNADVPLRDIEFLEIGTPTKVTIPETGIEYESIIDLIHPVNDAMSRTVTVRIIIDNPDNQLKPNTYVDAIFNARKKSRLAVPEEAILRSSMGAYVIENLGKGYFRPTMVKTGITSEGFTEITSGLLHGQSVVVSGQFLLDAESNLKGGMSAMGHDNSSMSKDGTGMKTETQDSELGEQQHVH